MGSSGAGSDLTWGGGAEAGGAGAGGVAEESFPETSEADGTSCDGVAFGWTFPWTAAEDFLSAAVVCGVAAEAGWTEMPGLALLEASFVVAAIGAVVAGLGAGMLEFGVRFGVKDGTLLGMLLAMLVVRLSAITNPVSGALAVFTAAVVVVCGAAAGPGWTETPGLASLGASFFVGAIGVGAIGTGPGAGALEFGVRFGVKGGALLLGILLEMSLEILSAMLSVRLGTMANPASAALAVCADAVLVALDGRT